MDTFDAQVETLVAHGYLANPEDKGRVAHCLRLSASDTKDLTVQDRGLSGVEERSVAEVKAQVGKIQSLMADVMHEGEHYGASFPGDKKKNLLKPGADKLCMVFRLAPEFEVARDDLPGGHREYRIKTILRNTVTGQIAGQGLGSCSTMESKYRWRIEAKRCPLCGKEAIIKGKEEYGGGWLCYKKKGGCGETFADDDPQITSQITGKVENTDIADTYNTVLKIAKKRSYVDATITVTAASDIFAQDAEDILPEAELGEQRNMTPAKPAQKSAGKVGPCTFSKFIEIVNTVVPSNERPGWMQQAVKDKSPEALGKLSQEIAKAFADGNGIALEPGSFAAEQAKSLAADIEHRVPIDAQDSLAGKLPKTSSAEAADRLRGESDEHYGIF
jgi:hypothetical protein